LSGYDSPVVPDPYYGGAQGFEEALLQQMKTMGA
jgi:hypothetical protein